MEEKISRGFLLSQMERLELNYGKTKFVADQPIFELWYEMFKDCSKEGFEKAVDKCIKENEFAPNVAGIMKYYREISAEHNDYVTLLKQQYTTLRAIWQEKEDTSTVLELYNYSLRFPEKQRKTLLEEYVHQACSYRHDCDACGRVDIPTIKQYLQGER